MSFALVALLSCGLHLGWVSPIRHAPLVRRAISPRAIAAPLDGALMGEDAIKVLYDGQCMVCVRREIIYFIMLACTRGTS